MKRENGILEVALHTRGGPLVFNGHVHEALQNVQHLARLAEEQHAVTLSAPHAEHKCSLASSG